MNRLEELQGKINLAHFPAGEAEVIQELFEYVRGLHQHLTTSDQPLDVWVPEGMTGRK